MRTGGVHSSSFLTFPANPTRALRRIAGYHGYSLLWEIASKLCLTKTAVSTRISRGRQFLRNIVEQEDFLMDA